MPHDEKDNMIRLPWTFSAYIVRLFFLQILIALLALIVVVELGDLVELIRRSAGKEAATLPIVLEMAALRLPRMMDQILPFAVLIGSMLALTRLTRTNELVVARAAGVSVWQFLTPALLVVVTLGIFFITSFNPLAAAMSMRYDQLEGRYLRGKPSLLTVSSSGLWLRQLDNDDVVIGERIIHAQRIDQKDFALRNVIVFSFDKTDGFLNRIDAASAHLESGNWRLEQAAISVPGEPATAVPEISIPTDFSIEQIQDSFAAPRTLSFWELPGFIHVLEKAGFSALRHKLYYNTVLSSPLLLCAMVLIAAVFSLRLPRRGGVGLLVAAGLLTGFTMRFMADIAGALGESGSLPVALAAWTPALIAILFGGAMLLHLEDG